MAQALRRAPEPNSCAGECLGQQAHFGSTSFITELLIKYLRHGTILRGFAVNLVSIDGAELFLLDIVNRKTMEISPA
jgi:hypothetical protein